MITIPLQEGDEGEFSRATYDPADDKLRLYSGKVSRDLYDWLRAQGWNRAYKQGCFFAVWTPDRETTATQLCGEIEDEDTTLMDRAEDRHVRFVSHRDNAEDRAHQAERAGEAAIEGIPFGQPILVGHHSEKHHRKAVEKAQAATDRTVKEYEQRDYWAWRAKAVLRHAERKFEPGAILRRIKTLEADLRKQTRERDEAATVLGLWQRDHVLDMKQALAITNYHDHLSVRFTLAEYPRDHDTYEGAMSLWSALDRGIITPEQAKAISVPAHERSIRLHERWMAHLQGEIAYWREVYAGTPGVAADKAEKAGMIIEKGGWVRTRYGWGQVERINKSGGKVVSVSLNPKTYSVNWMIRVVDYDRIKCYLSDFDYQAGKGIEYDRAEAEKNAGKPVQSHTPPADTEAARQQAQAVKEVEVVKTYDPDFFPAPQFVVETIIDLACRAGLGSTSGSWTLEPSAGDGRIADAVKAVGKRCNTNCAVDLVEIDHNARQVLYRKGYQVRHDDFMTYHPPMLYDFVLMNPPFSGNQAPKHILHAWELLAPGGRLVSVAPNGVTFRSDSANAELRALVDEYGSIVDLPDDAFKESGTMVKTCIVVLDRPKDPLPSSVVQATLW